MKLRHQIFAILSGVFAAILVAVLGVSVAGTRQYLEQQLASHAQDAATALSVTLGPSLGKGDEILAQAQVASVFDRGYFKRIAVLAQDRSAIINRELPEKIEGVPVLFARWVTIDAAPGEAFVGSGWRQLGKVVVQSQPTFAYQHLWATAVEQALWLLGFFVLTLLAMGGVLHYILLPLRAIERSAENVQAKKFVQIDQKPSAPELASVVVAMNQMSRKVGEMLDAEVAKAEMLRHQAYDDEMTGLTNRRGYEVRLVELLQGEQHFALGAVVAVEFDDMRLLNRKHGFMAGEHIMKTLANVARELFAPVPVQVLSHSNEFSFNFLAIDVQQAAAQELAAELRRRTLEALRSFEPLGMANMNTGLAFFHYGDTRSEVFARGDLAVETARQSERNGFAVLADDNDDHAALGSFGWRNLIQSALAENRWRLLRQPVLSLDGARTMLQQECMSRLVDAQGQMVPAANFMPMAARHRLMPDVDRAMVSLAWEVVRQGGVGQGVLAINLSPQSAADADFVAWLSEQLRTLGPLCKQLAFEVSEFGALRNPAAALHISEMLRVYGAKLGIDHFGLDPQGAQMLRDTVPHYVKLSGALTEDALSGPENAELLASFVRLAHSLDVVVIAQRVENQAQVDALAQVGVDAGQGYFFGAPQ